MEFAQQFSLCLTDLACARAGRPVVAGVSLNLAAGQAMQLFGPNGAGKSTLLAVIAGARAPDHGRVVWRDECLPQGSADDNVAIPHAQIAFLGHELGVKASLSVRENLEFWAGLYGAPAAKTLVDTTLEQMALSDLAGRRAESLSAGQRRRVDLARLILSSRPIWVLDEPTAAVDAANSAKFGALAQTHLARGGTIIAATHDTLGFAAKKVVLG